MKPFLWITSAAVLVGGMLFAFSAGCVAFQAAPPALTAAGKPFPVHHTEAEWKKLLSPEAFDVLRHAGTERAYTSPLLDEHRDGTFVCAACGEKLFKSNTKFDSGTGWPSFFQPIKGAVIERRDDSLGSVRTEVLCHRCGSHLGHVFDDGPKPTGLRYCMNGVALKFVPAKPKPAHKP